MKQIKVSVVVLFIFVVISAMESLAKAKSIYVITDHHATVMKAYEIQGDKIEYQQDVVVSDYGF